MNSKQKTGLAIGSAVIGIGAAFGVGYAFSGAATTTQAQAQPSQGSGQGEGPGGEGRGGGMGNMSNFAKALAEKLGVDEDKVTEALQQAMQANRPSGDASGRAMPSDGASSGAMPSGAPSNGGGPNGGGGPGGGGSGMDDQLAKSLAEALGLDEDTVAKAIEEVRSEQQTDQPSGDASQAPQPSASASA
ncbi:Clp protease N-terminal domain-containing protein [Micropruina sonneratiae]|uniref:Clp protease N-terminal domain-containing protein n=1 Tax=Micropruina sonneratiae TaxID=2986940 RepID=UPI002227E5BA|nr:Clp protease N-terminal domain-containing protein [Micropruina sp. KQZ13P-5]MCW3157282.1 hypothetical protein [Micropruina sp. KQZ13P-5]